MVLVIWGLVGCQQGEAPPAAPPPVPEVTFIPAWQQEVVDYQTYVGRTEPSETVDVRSRVYGYIQSVEFEDGQQVTEGQTLFQIEPDTYEAIHKQNLARVVVWETKLELAKTKLARQKRLFEQEAVAQDQLDEAIAAEREAVASVESAKADVSVSAVDLKYTSITAPISGRIDRALSTRGNLVTGGNPGSDGTLLTHIVKNSPLFVYFDVDETSLLKYSRDYKAATVSPTSETKSLNIPCAIKLATESDFVHQGIIDFAESRLNAGTGTIQVRGRFENKDNGLIGGLFVQVRLPVNEPHSAVMIPEESIASDQGTKYVYVLQPDDTAVRRPIKTGSQRGRARVVSEGLAAGERVVVKGGQRIRAGSKLSPRLDEQGEKLSKVSVEAVPASAPNEDQPKEPTPVPAQVEAAHGSAPEAAVPTPATGADQ